MFGRVVLSTLAVAMISASSANATTSGVCFGMANVPPRDALNMRVRPSARAPIVARFGNSSEVILAKVGACGRWCKVAASTGRGTQSGWINARYLRPRECP